MAANHWLFTLNNPDETIEQFTEKLENLAHVRYCLWQLELGDESEILHWQGYIELNRSQRMSWLRNNISDRAHYERRQGTRDQARDYCRKEDTRQQGPWEIGEWKISQQGNRTDITAFRDAIVGGKRKRELIEEYQNEMCKYPKFYDTVRSIYRPKREDDSFVGVVLLFGWPGTGKTRYVVENYPQYWESPIGSGLQWYDGYDGHEYVLFDDFAGKMSKVPLDTTLKIFDRYVRQVPVKGGHTWWAPNVIFITTNVHPRDWYEWEGREAQYQALVRRIKAVYWYKKDGTVEYQVDSSDFFEYSYRYDETLENIIYE